MRQEEEYLERKNQEWLMKQQQNGQNNYQEDSKIERQMAQDTLDLYMDNKKTGGYEQNDDLGVKLDQMKVRIESGNTFKQATKNILLKDVSRMHSGDHTPFYPAVEQNKNFDDVWQSPDDNVFYQNNKNDIEILDLQSEASSVKQMGQNNHPSVLDEDSTLAARVEGYKIFHEINKLAHERHKLQAEALYFEREKIASLNNFKQLNEEINRDTIRMGMDLNLHNLKHMAFSKREQVKYQEQPEKISNKNNDRMGKYEELKLYMAQKSIFNVS